MVSQAQKTEYRKIPNQELDTIYDFLEKQAKRRDVEIFIHRNIRQSDDWLYIPVYVNAGEDIVDRARCLQDIEDDWRNQEPEPYWQLMLIPAAN